MNLAIISRLSLLEDFYEKIEIPQAVWEEVVKEGEGKPGVEEVKVAKTKGWLEVVNVKVSPLLQLLRKYLDNGEAEAIAWAVQKDADLILLDESDAREIANLYSLSKTGIIGILMRAKREGKIRTLKRELDRLQNEAGFWIHQNLYRKVLKEAGEL